MRRSISLYNSPPADLILADPPWLTPKAWLPQTDKVKQVTQKNTGSYRYYDLLPTDQICNFPLPKLKNSAVLLLWRLGCRLKNGEYGPEAAMRVIRAWGFEPRAEIVWHKSTKNLPTAFGAGFFVRGAHEVCILATRGGWRSYNKSVRSVIHAQKREQSRKPEEIFEVAELLAGPKSVKVELFSRSSRPGWFNFGNQVDKFPTGLQVGT